MTEKDLDIAIEKCERIMEMDARTLKNPESENGWLFDKVYDLLQFLRQLQFATDTSVATTDTISRQPAELFDCEYRDIDNVVAWQPLPKPWEGEGHE